jgi:hypothetical protein
MSFCSGLRIPNFAKNGNKIELKENINKRAQSG